MRNGTESGKIHFQSSQTSFNLTKLTSSTMSSLDDVLTVLHTVCSLSKTILVLFEDFSTLDLKSWREKFGLFKHRICLYERPNSQNLCTFWSVLHWKNENIRQTCHGQLTSKRRFETLSIFIITAVIVRKLFRFWPRLLSPGNSGNFQGNIALP